MKKAVIEAIVLIVSFGVGIAVCFGGFFLSPILPNNLKDIVSVGFIALGTAVIPLLKSSLNKYFKKLSHME